MEKQQGAVELQILVKGRQIYSKCCGRQQWDSLVLLLSLMPRAFAWAICFACSQPPNQ